MIRILLCLLFLEVSFCILDDTFSDFQSSGGPPSSEDEHGRRNIRDVAGRTKFGEKGNYITTVVFVDVPSLSNSTVVGDVFDHADKFNIQYKNVVFAQLSSAYALGYRIDLSANVVQLILRLGKAHIKGTYSVSTSSSPNPTTSQGFELNLYADLIYTHQVSFEVDKQRKATFGKAENQYLLYKKVKGKYTNPPSALATDMENYLNPSLLKAVVAKIYDEVRQKVSLTDVGFQIKNEVDYKHRNEIADRFKKAVTNAFEDIPENPYNVYYSDKTNFQRVIQNRDVTIPTVLLRDVEGLKAEVKKMSFVGDHVRVKVQFVVSSPVAWFRIAHRNRLYAAAQNTTFKGQFQLSNVIFEVELVANPETNAVDFENAGVKVSDAQVASTQGLYGDERDAIIKQLTPYIKSYFSENASAGFARYVKGFVADGRIANQVFN